MKEKSHAFDILGNIAIMKFSQDTKAGTKKQIAKEIMSKNKSITTVLEKVGKFSGRLRKQQTKFVAGIKTKEAKYKENNCIFRFNVDKTYFSPRLSNERKEIASKIKKNENVLVMFAGVAPFSIVIAKNSRASRVWSNEINREANKYAKLNIELNRLKDKVILLSGDVKKIKTNEKFDVIVMPRPQLKDTFLKQAFSVSKKGTMIYYYDFCKADEVNSVIEKIKAEAKKASKKIKILNKKSAGEIAPYKIRLRVDLKVL